MKSYLGSFSDLMLGIEWPELLIQFSVLVLGTLVFMRFVIKTRIGAMEAVEIVSYFRLVLGVAVCNLAFLGAYHLLLHLMRPSWGFWSMLKYVGAQIACYFIVGIVVVAPISLVIDGGRAIRVLSGRFKPGPQPHLVDLTKNQGRYAQLIARGVAAAYLLLITLSVIAISQRADQA